MSAAGALLMLGIPEENRFKRQLRSLLSAYGGSKRITRAILCRYRCYEPMIRTGFARYDVRRRRRRRRRRYVPPRFGVEGEIAIKINSRILVAYYNGPRVRAWAASTGYSPK